MIWLIGHMWLLLVLALLLGLVLGCWICSRPPVDDAPDLEADLARLCAQAEVCTAQKAKLRSEVSEMKAELAQAKKVLGKLPAPLTVPTFYDAPRRGAPDVLTNIKGVGPKLETVLHSLGVYYYQQIANWTDEQIDEVDEKLTFKGRILRDDWRAQAAKLYDTKKG